MELQLSKKEIQRIRQLEWYHRNKERVKVMKQSWYEKNREKALAKNKEWRDKMKARNEQELERGIVIDNTTPKTYNVGLTFFEILDILRKDNRHYLWGKSVTNWTERDWFNFIELKDA